MKITIDNRSAICMSMLFLITFLVRDCFHIFVTFLSCIPVFNVIDRLFFSFILPFYVTALQANYVTYNYIIYDLNYSVIRSRLLR